MGKRANLVGMTFGRLQVVSFHESRRNGSLWKCICECENTCYVLTGALVKGNGGRSSTQSCGCLKREMTVARNYKHGRLVRITKWPEALAFTNAKHRCDNPKNKRYADYGGRGIKFLVPSLDAMIEAIGRRPSKDHSLDRINNHGNYEVGNLKWSTRSEQQLNTRRSERAQHGDTGAA